MPETWEGAAEAPNLAQVRAFVQDFCRRVGADPQASFDLKLAVDEACTNIVEHGYVGMPQGDMRVSIAFDGERLTVVISDHGRSFDPERIAPPDIRMDCEEREPGGLGWHLIRSTVDGFRYESGAGEGNLLTLVKRARGSGKI
ncbi:MAG TPA: ATP-binding protein [Thermoanaerobaculia bacterium]|nr:ATP-binding protein [Thermoanaerobaculia bacterium]